ncbi:hypothetical protein ZIOFF_008681 [Zingiber officinale]|uniref:Protein FAR1-RELATED SEQUENCE n=1 Tax=Zingiber officinale TaxID=94328 RepID=A0A8J5M6Y2_ZINOF|nr:hypothetical protein ZIOFF_008681 [Zingiber officinale]
MEQERLIEGDFQVLGDSSSSNGVDTPQVGMCFSAEEEVRDFYKSYAQILGFGIAKLGSKKGDDGPLKYFSFGCSKNGKTAPRVKNSFYPRPCSKMDCKAKINITVQNDGSCVITSIQLEHNHALSPRKSRHFRCNKVLDSQTKRKLELNDQAGITLSKSFQSFVVEAGGYENLSFDERKCRNYVAESRRLRLGNGDAEALNNYFCRMQIISGNPIEKQLQSVYTNKIFKLFQDELRVMVKRNITIVPENYILERWRKDIKRGYQGITNIYDDSYHHAEERQRYNNLQPLLQEVGQLGSKNDERCFVLTGILKEAKKRIIDINIGDSFDGYQDSNKIYEESRNESKQFHSPLKSSTVDKKQDELSNMNSPSMIDDESSKNVSCDFTRLCTKAYAGEMELMTKEREYAGFMFMTFRHFFVVCLRGCNDVYVSPISARYYPIGTRALKPHFPFLPDNGSL